uniref:J domain-containing protein n=1 Tax=Percolomonas cosmopolitus TaxID=63605 RepID=A0A7S1KLN9_9EUKA|mmetsp:Transcript_111/g.409  ORF Transcript_111/g.409 Transcript_111/m.409 type:complete len:352 (+) Transcript_111:47-1102(+)
MKKGWFPALKAITQSLTRSLSNLHQKQSVSHFHQHYFGRLHIIIFVAFCSSLALLMPTLSRLPNYYKLLQVPKSASVQQVKSSYYRLAKIYHPDVVASRRKKEQQDGMTEGEPSPSERMHLNSQEQQQEEGDMFKKISEAYHILKNDQLRRKYDFELKRQEDDEHQRRSVHHHHQQHQGGGKTYADFKNQYEYKHYDKRQQYEDPDHDFDYNKHHKYETKYQQYFHQRNVHTSTPFHSFRSPDGKWKQEKVSYKYDPYTNTHFYHHSKEGGSSSFREQMEEEYRNYYTMQGTYDSYHRSKNIPTIFGFKVEWFLALLAVAAIMYGLSQYTFTETYKPYSNVYDKNNRESKR